MYNFHNSYFEKFVILLIFGFVYFSILYILYTHVPSYCRTVVLLHQNPTHGEYYLSATARRGKALRIRSAEASLFSAVRNRGAHWVWKFTMLCVLEGLIRLLLQEKSRSRGRAVSIGEGADDQLCNLRSAEDSAPQICHLETSEKLGICRFCFLMFVAFLAS